MVTNLLICRLDFQFHGAGHMKGQPCFTSPCIHSSLRGVHSYKLFGVRQSQLYFSNVFNYYYIPTTCFGPYGPSSCGMYVLVNSQGAEKWTKYFKCEHEQQQVWLTLPLTVICNLAKLCKYDRYSLESVLRLLGSGVNAAVSTALGITDTRLQWTLALSTVFSFLCRTKRQFIKPIISENTAVGIRHTDHVAPSIRKSWQSLH
jgi:hypothetical protein